MMQWKTRFAPVFLLSALLILAACGPKSGPTRQVIAGEQQTINYFSRGNEGWDIYTMENDIGLFRVNQGALEGAVVAGMGYIWSLNNTVHQDVIINAQLRQQSGAFGNGFGVMCRADSAGNGYYFLISSDGQFSIQKAVAGEQQLVVLQNWQSSPIILKGYQRNQIKAVCTGNYLALFVNDVFMTEIFDEDYTEGMAGAVLGAFGETLWVAFDNYSIRNAFSVGR